jgi:hypothetical protein
MKPRTKGPPFGAFCSRSQSFVGSKVISVDLSRGHETMLEVRFLLFYHPDSSYCPFLAFCSHSLLFCGTAMPFVYHSPLRSSPISLLSFRLSLSLLSLQHISADLLTRLVFFILSPLPIHSSLQLTHHSNPTNQPLCPSINQLTSNTTE